ncbi:MAG: hypothetical protein HGA97_09520 [Chlorobiaceae bacterium]|nr:hypothetical protein [Chlorobiaceae bacterium]
MPNDIPVGDLQLYDNYVPQLEAGNWSVKVEHTLTAKDGKRVNGDTLSAQQEFVVSGPQFSFDPNQVINRYPPSGGTGRYGEVLPHIVLNDPMLPWERKMVDAYNRQPWIALMVFEESELIGGESNVTHTITTTVGDFLKLDGATLAPKPVKEDDVEECTSCAYIQMPVSIFSAHAPRLDELRFLAHCRQVNTGDKAMMGLNEHGLFSVIVSNRFPAVPPAGSDKPVKNIVHLVSLEGMEIYLSDKESFGSFQKVALITLASWVFYSLPDVEGDFRKLVLQLVDQESDQQSIRPDRLWLRLPPPRAGSEDPASTEVTRRITDGYIPLLYHTRTGEETFAWYRGPLAPVLPAAIDKKAPFFTSDAALIYDKEFGVFDVSLAAAWEAGREAALADRLFGQRLLEFRQRTHRVVDTLHNRLNSDHFSETQIKQLAATSTIQDQFLTLLNTQLIKEIGADPDAISTPPQIACLQSEALSTDPVAAMKEFTAGEAVQRAVQTLVQDDLAPIAEWLGRLLVLYPLPFNDLVADERLLPVESLRFFYLDQNWLDALLDGALSIGLDSSRQTFFCEVTKEMLQKGAMEAVSVCRHTLRGEKPDVTPDASSLMSGLLLRSALVSGWPNLAVRPKDKSEKLLRILRMDHLAPNVLLCIFDGVPATVELSEPQEGFRFGVDDDGNAVLRNLKGLEGATTTTIGEQIGTFLVRDMTGKNSDFMRTPGGRVLNLAPTSKSGLVQRLKIALADAGSAIDTALSPADFALQMIKSPEAIVFNSQQ